MSFPQNAIVYFGATPNEKQIVAKENKDVGVELLRKDTSSIAWEGAPTTVQANYGLYVSNISSFLFAANEKQPCILAGSAYGSLDYDGDLPKIPYPSLVVNWGFAIADEVADSLRSKGFRDMQVRGKACMVHSEPSVEIMKAARATKCLLTSPCVQDQMNIASFRSLMFLQKVLGAFFKMHQYPAFVDWEHESAYRDLFGSEDNLMEIDEPIAGEGEVTAEGSKDSSERKKRIRSFPISLPTPFDEAPVQVSDKFKPTSSGIFLKYLSSLASFDARTPIAVINRHFYHLLGDGPDQAAEVFEKLKTSWGVLFKTEAGKIISHMYLCVDMALRLQTSVIPLIPKQTYAGMLMLGSGYTLKVENRDVEVASVSELLNIISIADGHSQSLWKIFRLLKFQDDETRIARYRQCKRMHHLKGIMDATSVGGNEAREEVARYLPSLNFQEVPLSHTGPNIVYALECIGNPSYDLTQLPYLHYSQVFSTNRRHIIWSAFGETAPSFRVPAGKSMSLTSKFEIAYTTKTKEKRVKAVSKIGIHIVDLSLALSHLDLTFSDRLIMNPFANAQVRVSDNSMFKSIEGKEVDLVVGAFRRAMGVATVTDEASVGKKRKASDVQGGPSKKRNVLESDDEE